MKSSYILFTLLLLSAVVVCAPLKDISVPKIGEPCNNNSTSKCIHVVNRLDPKRVISEKSKQESWSSGFMKTLLMILSMEIGDKTFFIGAILAMSHNKWFVFLGSVSALVVMCIISCVIGVTAPILMSRDVTVVIAAVLFVFFGIRMIIEGFKKDNQSLSEEYEEAEESVRQHMTTDTTHSDVESGLIHDKSQSDEKNNISSILIKTFIMVFFAEWGDRSQFSTLFLASTHPVTSVVAGATCGYIISTLCGVLGGNFFAKVISPRIISIVGGLLFILFAVQIVLTKD